MKDILFKYYDIRINNYEDYSDGIIFVVAGIKYLFIKCNYTENLINDLIIDLEKVFNTVKLHTLIRNNENKYISDGYILERINVLEDEISLYDVSVFNSIVLNDTKKYLDMSSFWYKKIDYIENQVHDLSSNKLINNSLDYYIGVSELILANLKNHMGSSKITLSHKYLNGLSTLEFYNPLNLSFDLWLKDICYYVKYKKNYDYIIKNINNLNDYEINYVFSRLCFPFGYFEEVSDIILNNKDEKGLLKIIASVNEYEEYLLKMEKMFNIYIFEWIKK